MGAPVALLTKPTRSGRDTLKKVVKSRPLQKNPLLTSKLGLQITRVPYSLTTDPAGNVVLRC